MATTNDELLARLLAEKQSGGGSFRKVINGFVGVTIITLTLAAVLWFAGSFEIAPMGAALPVAQPTAHLVLPTQAPIRPIFAAPQAPAAPVVAAPVVAAPIVVEQPVVEQPVEQAPVMSGRISSGEQPAPVLHQRPVLVSEEKGGSLGLNRRPLTFDGSGSSQKK